MLRAHKADPKVSFINGEQKIFITPTALHKMSYYIDLHDKEIGWLGSVVIDGGSIVVLDTFLFKQQVGAATCEITPEGLSDFAMEILGLPNGMEVYNSIRLWGHSHVSMGVSPSGQDDSQMKIFSESGAEFFLRCIGNKKGQMEFTFYDYRNGIVIKDVPWEVIVPADTSLKAVIKAEIEAKVSNITYASSYTTNYNSGRTGQNSYGYWQDGEFHSWTEEKKTVSPNVFQGTNVSSLKDSVATLEDEAECEAAWEEYAAGLRSVVPTKGTELLPGEISCALKNLDGTKMRMFHLVNPTIIEKYIEIDTLETISGISTFSTIEWLAQQDVAYAILEDADDVQLTEESTAAIKNYADEYVKMIMAGSGQ